MAVASYAVMATPEGAAANPGTNVLLGASPHLQKHLAAPALRLQRRRAMKKESDTNIQIKVEGEWIQGHASVLGTHCAVIDRAVQDREPPLRLDFQSTNITKDAMLKVFEYCYTGEIRMTRKLLQPVLRAAVRLEVHGLVTLLEEYLMSMSKQIQYALYALQVGASTPVSDRVVSELVENCVAHFPDMLKEPAFLMVSVESLCMLLSRNSLRKRITEGQILLAALDWIYTDQKTQIMYAEKVLSCVRFNKMQIAEIETLMARAFHTSPGSGSTFRVSTLVTNRIQAAKSKALSVASPNSPNPSPAPTPPASPTPPPATMPSAAATQQPPLSTPSVAAVVPKPPSKQSSQDSKEERKRKKSKRKEKRKEKRRKSKSKSAKKSAASSPSDTSSTGGAPNAQGQSSSWVTVSQQTVVPSQQIFDSSSGGSTTTLTTSTSGSSAGPNTTLSSSGPEAQPGIPGLPDQSTDKHAVPMPERKELGFGGPVSRSPPSSGMPQLPPPEHSRPYKPATPPAKRDTIGFGVPVTRSPTVNVGMPPPPQPSATPVVMPIRTDIGFGSQAQEPQGRMKVDQSGIPQLPPTPTLDDIIGNDLYSDDRRMIDCPHPPGQPPDDTGFRPVVFTAGTEPTAPSSGTALTAASGDQSSSAFHTPKGKTPMSKLPQSQSSAPKEFIKTPAKKVEKMKMAEKMVPGLLNAKAAEGRRRTHFYQTYKIYADRVNKTQGCKHY